MVCAGHDPGRLHTEPNKLWSAMGLAGYELGSPWAVRPWARPIINWLCHCLGRIWAGTAMESGGHVLARQ